MTTNSRVGIGTARKEVMDASRWLASSWLALSMACIEQGSTGSSARWDALSQKRRTDLVTVPLGDNQKQLSFNSGAADAADSECFRLCCSHLNAVLWAIVVSNSESERSLFDVPPASEINRAFARGHYRQWQTCPCSPAQEDPPDYFLQGEGPEQSNYPGLLVYERGGNHGQYRHLLIENVIMRVTEHDWLKMRQNPDYVPSPVFKSVVRVDFR